MHRNVTALYRSHGAVELVRRELTDIGVAHGDIRVVPDAALSGDYADAGESAPLAALHDLDLPESDLRDYEDRVRRGDFLVSVAVDEDRVPQVEEIMRRPEDLAHMHQERGAAYDDFAAVDEPHGDAPRSGVLGRDDRLDAETRRGETGGARGNLFDEAVVPDPARDTPRGTRDLP